MTNYWNEDQVADAVRVAMLTDWGIRASLEEHEVSANDVVKSVINELLKIPPGFTLTMDLNKSMSKGDM